MNVLAVDPGESAGMVLVSSTRERPAVRSITAVHGSSWDLWLSRVREVIRSSKPDVLALERPAANARSTRGKLGPATFLGLGERMGAIWALAFSEGVPVQIHEQDKWAKFWRLRAGKSGDGEHRVAEASMYLVGFQVLISAMPRTTDAERERRVACSEAALLGGFVAMTSTR